MIETLTQDIRIALRTLLKTPTFTAAVIATVALGVGSTTAMFSVVYAILLRPLPFPESERTLVLCETNPSIGDWCGASPMNVADWGRTSRTLESAGVARTESFVAHTGNQNYGVMGGIGSPGFFRVLQLRPMLGRLIEDRDMPRGANRVAIVSHRFWQSRLGSDPRAVGREIILDEQLVTIVGVLPAGAYIPGPGIDRVEVWRPLTASIDNVENRSWRGFSAVGRLAPGVSASEAGAELETIRAQLQAAYPEANKGWGLRIGSLRKQIVGDISQTLWVFLGAVALVLLIACANVASLMLVRASSRAPEFAVRASLGARRSRLTQQLITESFVLSMAGGALGILLAGWATAAFRALAPGSIPRVHEILIDGRMVLFAFLLSAITALLFGCAPARQASKVDLNTVLKGVRTTRRVDARLRSALVVAELALALMLLVGAALLTRSFGRLLGWDPGFDRTGIVTTWMLPPRGIHDAVALMLQVRDAVAAIPGVRAGALASAGPLFGGVETGSLKIDGRPEFAPGDMPTIEWFDIGPQYFETLGIRQMRGRGFTAADTGGAPAVAIVNETFARRFFSDGNPIGRRVTVQDHPSEIVGIVADVKPLRPDQPVAPQIYWPITQYRRGAAYLVIRTTPGIAGIERVVQARVASINPVIQLSPFVSIDERLSDNLVRPRFNVVLVAAFAAMALLLAAVGVYGVIAYAVTSRTREIGVQIALGATPRRVVRAIVRRGMMLAAAGIAIGCAGALALGRLLAGLLYGLPPHDPLTLSLATAVFALVAFAACWLPARRASRVDPISALREG